MRVSGDDHERLSAAGEPLTRFIGNRCYMRVVDGHCAALSIRRLGRRFFCTTYETRPQTCRTLERGSAECLAEFERKHRRRTGALMMPVLT